MALAHSPKIVTDGLVFAYDMANDKKSWNGAPTTNQFTLPTSDTNGFGVQNSTFTRVRTGNYGGYEIQPTDYVWMYNISGNDCPYHGWDIPTTAGAVVTFSFDYYVDPTTANYPITNQLANMENAGSGVGGGYSDPTPSIKGVWKKGYFSSTATATGNSRCLLYPGGCGSRLGDSGFILYKNPQVEFNAPGSIPTPFVAGTRSNTQAMLDLTGNNTITANSLTYNSNNTFSFNGSNNYIDINNNALISGTNPYTIDTWYTRVSGTGAIFGNYGTGYTSNTIWVFAGGLYFNGSYYITNYGSRIAGTHNICVTKNSAGAINVYFDGNLEVSSTNTTAVSTSQNYRIGADVNGAGEPFSGNIYSVKVYNRELSVAEVKQNFNAIKGGYVGSSSNNPAYSASQIKSSLGYKNNPVNGIYWLQPLNATTPFQAYIDFTTPNGPWVHVGNAYGGTTPGEIWVYPSTWVNRTTNYGSEYLDPTSATNTFNAGAFIYCKGNRIMLKEGGGNAGAGGSVGYTQVTGLNNESWRNMYEGIDMTTWPVTPSYRRILTIDTSYRTVGSSSLIYGTNWSSVNVYDQFIVYCFDSGTDTMAMLTTATYPSNAAIGECDCGVGANENGAAVGSPSNVGLSSGVSYDMGSNGTIATNWSNIPFSLWIQN